MTVAIDKGRIRQRFSDAAGSYGDLADIQTAIACDLISKAHVEHDTRVLDVGAGDGVVAWILADSGARIVAIDAAWGMTRQGQRRSVQASWVQADAAALPFSSMKFDMVISSSAYQWVDDLAGAFAEARRVLKPGGRLMAAMFAYGTLDELFVSLEKAAHAAGRKLPPLRRLPAHEDVIAALHQAGFKDPLVRIEKRVTWFKDVKAILAWLKGIGANASARNFFWGKTLLTHTEKEYRLNFAQGDDLSATFEIIWIDTGV